MKDLTLLTLFTSSINIIAVLKVASAGGELTILNDARPSNK